MKSSERAAASMMKGFVKSRVRPHQQFRAFEDEFQVIKQFMYLVREIGVERAQLALDVLRSEFKVGA